MFKFALKLVAGFACLALLIWFNFIDFSTLARAVDHPAYTLAAFILLLLTVPLAAWRWLLLLRGVDANGTLAWSLSTTFVSQFFNTFLPGAYGGDLVRFGLAVKANGGKAGQIFFTIFIDRLAGLVALLLFAIGVLPFLPVGHYVNLVTLSGILFVGLACGFAVALIAGEAIARLVEKLPSPIGSIGAHLIRETITALRAFRHRPGLVATVVVISVVQYALVLLALIALGGAMEITSLSSAGYVVAGVWGLVANSLPVTPGGLGVGESAFAAMAAFVDKSSNPASFGNVFLASRVLSVVVSLGGLIPLLFGGVLVNRNELDAVVRQSSLREESTP